MRAVFILIGHYHQFSVRHIKYKWDSFRNFRIHFIHKICWQLSMRMLTHNIVYEQPKTSVTVTRRRVEKSKNERDVWSERQTTCFWDQSWRQGRKRRLTNTTTHTYYFFFNVNIWSTILHWRCQPNEIDIQLFSTMFRD